MLNISKNKLNKTVDLGEYDAIRKLNRIGHYKYFNRFLIAFTAIALVILFLPWTQNIQGRGFVTTLQPDNRPQTIQSPIPGKIEKWFVREGDFVEKGDTILFISEVKDKYFDPDLLERTQKQLEAKNFSIGAYEEKIKALDVQVSSLRRERELKLSQVENKLKQSYLKVKSDSIDYEAAKTLIQIAERQYERTESLQREGLKSLTELEMKKLKLQEAQAKLISQENKLLASKNEVINARVEISRVKASYTDKISKAESEKYTAMSGQFDAEAQFTKLENQYTNYERRNELYYVRAPQNGFINKAIRGGLGETFKEGEQLLSIMPANYELAVETYVEPIDLPLIQIGAEVRVQFDGWPAIVFNGWPNASYGTYGAKVVAIETFISDNGKYRVLLAPDPEDHQWPEKIRVGSGAATIALLDDVPIWYEAWRKLNGFPANYYQQESEKEEAVKKSQK
ncbi:HlyD family efflux transporter periplasmic adaptor subunit [Leptobacterium flavescens]|uniref:HlyD family efflux transporter periplasmic adaptor subunit n=1 Tax=Leptobacterium flavescens TaxID=472055 RepID=A0A6P0UPU8_9FLAO|nr:HlyD family efflux transporter periplasmic adaptor subunit [Leptobacterium flavescens]NER15351.1 HlyD family efflux transporter periplasmic adaptor subunit [Leptobacterium flavescens]